ncbi:MAG: hypothetical protein CMD25_07475 [Flavobacteriales bacterium]|nr:hypothetical protein [Flavobacteriales bacterium]|tara:strand:+ start:2940 stop:3473 length:534 start_codon:yes stop_codon:yes gene_type:complete
MKNFYSITIIFFIILTFISCKKEEDPILGCTDSSAMNYNSDANSNDGSCLIAYDIAQGLWNINPNCDDLNIPVLGDMISLNDALPESIEVDGSGGNIIFIEISENQVEGTIDNDGNVIVSSQDLQLDMGGMGLDFPVSVSGSGLIIDANSGTMNLTFSFDIPLIGTQSSSCEIILEK